MPTFDLTLELRNPDVNTGNLMTIIVKFNIKRKTDSTCVRFNHGGKRPETLEHGVKYLEVYVTIQFYFKIYVLTSIPA